MPAMFERLVNSLTIQEIARRWQKERPGESVDVIETMLIEAHVYRTFVGGPHPPEVVALRTKPDQIRLTRDELRAICKSEDISPPRFWFGRDPKLKSFPGRPSVMAAIEEQMRKRSVAGELCETVTEESRYLETWAKKEMPGVHTPTAKTIRNRLGGVYRELKMKEPPE